MRGTKTIYLDESGFTGKNLLDPAQPVFVVASTDLDDNAASDILREAFPRYQGDEFKFKNIWGSKNKERLLQFCSLVSKNPEKLCVWSIDKAFCTLTKIVDFLIEPTVTNAGYDFYSDGFCWKYANYIHYGLTEFGDAELLPTLLKSYHDFSRDPNPETLTKLNRQLVLMANSVDEHIKIFFEQMALGTKHFNRFHDISTFGDSNEVQLTSVLSSVMQWRQRHAEDFIVMHDDSSNFFGQAEVWSKITDSDVPNQLHQIGDGTFVEFPLRVIRTIPTNSKSSHSIQLCDVVAGVATKICAPVIKSDDREFLERLTATGFGEVQSNGLRPQTVFPDHIPPRKLVGPDAVDRMTKIINR